MAQRNRVDFWAFSAFRLWGFCFFFGVLALCGTARPSVAWVAVDVGHSLRKPGSIAASGTTEFALNRALAQEVAARLSASGIPYKLIGLAGEKDELAARTAAATGAALFVSLHHDSVQPHHLPRVTDFSGFSVFVSRRNPYPQQSYACARRMGERFRAAGRRPTPHHAEPIKGENRPMPDPQRGIYYYDGLYVLRKAVQPAILVEAGIAVNPQEEAWLRSAQGRQVTADAVASGIIDCWRDLRRE